MTTISVISLAVLATIVTTTTTTSSQQLDSTASSNSNSSSQLKPAAKQRLDEVLRPLSYAVDDATLEIHLRGGRLREIDAGAFVGRKLRHIDLSHNQLGLIHAAAFNIGPLASWPAPSLSSKPPPLNGAGELTRPRHLPPPVLIDLSNNPAILAVSGAFDHIHVPNCMLNFTNTPVDLRFGAFRRYLRSHPGHLITIDQIDCCHQEWLLSFRHNFGPNTRCEHDPAILVSKHSRHSIVASCIARMSALARQTGVPPTSLETGQLLDVSKMSGGVASAESQVDISQSSEGPFELLGPTDSSAGEQQFWLTCVALGGLALVLAGLSTYLAVYLLNFKPEAI